jgi:hypothetical protein
LNKKPPAAEKKFYCRRLFVWETKKGRSMIRRKSSIMSIFG